MLRLLTASCCSVLNLHGDGAAPHSAVICFDNTPGHVRSCLHASFRISWTANADSILMFLCRAISHFNKCVFLCGNYGDEEWEFYFQNNRTSAGCSTLTWRVRASPLSS